MSRDDPQDMRALADTLHRESEIIADLAPHCAHPEALTLELRISGQPDPHIIDLEPHDVAAIDRIVAAVPTRTRHGVIGSLVRAGLQLIRTEMDPKPGAVYTDQRDRQTSYFLRRSNINPGHYIMQSLAGRKRYYLAIEDFLEFYRSES